MEFITMVVDRMLNVDRFKLPETPFSTEITELLDFQDYPILTLETDSTGTQYLSYLHMYVSDRIEQRVYAEISTARLELVRSGEMSVNAAYRKCEKPYLFVNNVDVSTGKFLSSSLVPLREFLEMDPLPENYYIHKPHHPHPGVTEESVMRYALTRDRLILNILLQASDLTGSVRPWVFQDILLPLLNLLKILIGMDNSQLDSVVSMTGFQTASLNLNIELEYTPSAFDEPAETIPLMKLAAMMSSRSEDDYLELPQAYRSKPVLEEYTKMMRAITKHDATFSAIVADPVSKTLESSRIDKNAADSSIWIFRRIDEAKYDTEYVTGLLLDVNLAAKTPVLTIEPIDDKPRIRAKISPAIISKIKNDYLNIGRFPYLCTIRQVRTPASPFREEDTESLLVDYSVVDDDGYRLFSDTE
jgi:hypothetical protein